MPDTIRNESDRPLRRREDTPTIWNGKSFDRFINILQVLAIVGGGFYAIGKMEQEVSGLRSDLVDFEHQTVNSVSALSSRIDSILLAGRSAIPGH